MKSRWNIFKHFHSTRAKISLILFTAIILIGCGEDTTKSNAQNRETLKLSASVGDFSDFIRHYIGPELEKKGYDVELLEVTSANIHNLSVQDGSIHANLFQHKPYLDDYNLNHKTNLTPLVQVPTAPFGVYSGKLQNLDQIQTRSKVGIPSNATNLARGLWTLEQLKLIKLNENAPDRFKVTQADITENPYNLQIIEVPAEQLIRARPDLDFAVISGNYIIAAGVHFNEALYIESSKHFVNWIVVKDGNIDQPWAKDIVEIVNSDGFKEYIAENFEGYDLPPNW
ncbi:MetQ/NlpA family ABC transporter substrate-binding protein [Ignatzschineria sp. LJL83]